MKMCIAFGRVMDEVFGDENFCRANHVQKNGRLSIGAILASVYDYILWYAKRREHSQISPAL